MLTYGFCLGPSGTEYSAESFSGAMKAFSGDGVTSFGKQYSASVRTGFTIALASGIAHAGGYFLKSTETELFTLADPQLSRDRYDVIAVKVDTTERNAILALVYDAGTGDISGNPGEYFYPLWRITVRRGATGLKETDLEDLRGDLIPLDNVSGVVERAYQYVSLGLETKVDEIEQAADTALEQSDARVQRIDSDIDEIQNNRIGDIAISIVSPEPAEEWLLCDGRLVPTDYPALRALIGRRLPNYTNMPDKINRWIYGGASSGLSYNYSLGTWPLGLLPFASRGRSGT